VDAKLLAWARATAARARRHSPLPRRPIPPLWLFTDADRLQDPRASVARLPRGLAGVVLRHDGHKDRARLGRDLARICRARRLSLVVAGDARLAAALHAGVHLRGGRWPGAVRVKGFITSSAHGFPDCRRAAHAGATLVFLSPVFATASHPGAPSLGPMRWSRLMRGASIAAAALGGIDGRTVRALPRDVTQAVGAIGALA
jgi:thiamine-phosphate pyrophosphorylase